MGGFARYNISQHFYFLNRSATPPPPPPAGDEDGALILRIERFLI
jgi:hypothetical protein